MIGKWAFNAACECGKVYDLYRHKDVRTKRLTLKCSCSKLLIVEPRMGSWRMPKVTVESRSG